MTLEEQLVDALDALAEARAVVLVKAGANPNTHDDIGFTVLWRACAEGLPELAHALLDAGADPTFDPTGCSATLPHAAWHGHLELCLRLIEHGAAVDAVGRGAPAIVHAVAQGNVPLVRALLARGADPAGVLIWIALDKQDLAMLQVLLHELGVDPNCTDAEGETLLHHAAAKHGDPRVAAALVAAGADLQARSCAGQTPLEKARACGNRAMADWLEQRCGQ